MQPSTPNAPQDLESVKQLVGRLAYAIAAAMLALILTVVQLGPAEAEASTALRAALVLASAALPINLALGVACSARRFLALGADGRPTYIDGLAVSVCVVLALAALSSMLSYLQSGVGIVALWVATVAAPFLTLALLRRR